MSVIIAPSILSADFADLKNSIKQVSDYVDFLHIDVMDGHFVPNLTIGAPVIKALRPHFNNVFDVHLMISNPLDYIKDFVDAGSDYITVHYEAKNFLEAIKEIKLYCKKCGISIKPGTRVEEIKEYLPLLDLVLVMSVEPGFGGQKFMDSAVNKIKELKEIKSEQNLSYIIACDGGINSLTKVKCIEAGVDLLVAGNYIFKAENKKKAIDSLK